MALVAPNRKQLETMTGKDHDLLTKIESLFQIVAALPVQPITTAIDSNETYSLVNEEGQQVILIPESMLVASVGGPFILTLTTGVGTDLQVPIAAAGDTITSGDLLFRVNIDSLGNLSSESWSITGSNANGEYQLSWDGTMKAWLTLTGGIAVQVWAYPREFAAPPVVPAPGMIGAGAIFASVSANSTIGITTSGWNAAGAPDTSDRYCSADGRWRT